METDFSHQGTGKTEQAEKCIYITQSDDPALFILVTRLQTLRLWQGQLWESRFSCIAIQGIEKRLSKTGKELRA